MDDSSTESSAPAKSKEVEDEDDDSSSETADDVSKSLDDVVDEDEQAPAAGLATSNSIYSSLHFVKIH